MARAVALCWLCIAVAFAAQSSCGGTSGEVRAAAARESVPAAQPPSLALAAREPRQAPEPAPAPELAEPQAAQLPIPDDAFLEHEGAEQGMRAAFEQRYPLHGVAFHLQAQIFSEPNERGQVIGYLRRGTRFRAAAGKSGKGCDRSWHELATGGFVCSGRGFVLGKSPQDFEPSPVPAIPYDALPYAYAKNIAREALQYWRIPTAQEENAALTALAAVPEELRHPQASDDGPPAPTSAPAPPAAVAAKSAPAPSPAPTTPAAAPLTDPLLAFLPDYTRMPMEPGFYVSVDRGELVDANAQPLDPSTPPCEPADAACAKRQRAFVRTVRGAYVPASVLKPVQLTPSPSGALGPELDLPLGIVYRGSAKVLAREPLEGAWNEGERLPRWSRVALTGARAQLDRGSYLVARSGALVADTNVRVAERVVRPPLVPRRARLIHVHLASQTLVAYEGDRAVFATLVATGKETFDTPPGLYRIISKHVSTTMDGLAGSEDAYSIEDVPFTMYFQGSYALHGAFWHDRFGAVRSHGCVNLAPADAQFLFRWAGPVLPNGWHGVLATKDNPGTFLLVD